MASTLLSSSTFLRPSSAVSTAAAAVKLSSAASATAAGCELTRSVDSIRLRRSPPSSSAVIATTFRVSAAADSSDATLQLPTISEAKWKSLVLESELPVMVEFWAPWCGPCRMVQPLIDELAQQYAGKLKVYKVNTDECANIASEYGIRSIPTVIVFKNGEKKEAVIGAVPKSTLTTCIEKFL